MQTVFSAFDGEGDGGGGGDRVPNDPRNLRFEGPWLQQQLVLAGSIGIISFLLFSLIRRRSPALFAPRTKLKGFSPHIKGIDDGIFSWIWPTLKTREIEILHIVGLDAAILLSFFKMSFWLFFFLSLWSCGVLMPVNYSNHGTIDGVAPSEDVTNPDKPGEKAFAIVSLPQPFPHVPWMWTFPTTTPYHFTHLLSTYLFSALIMRTLYKGYHKFVRSRQLYALDLLQSIPARTVEVRNLPDHLRREKDLAEYFEALGLKVESTTVVRQVHGLKGMLSRRANALYELERAWCKWLGNPTTADNYDSEKIMTFIQARTHAEIDNADGERLVRAAEGRDVAVDDEEVAPLLNGTALGDDPTMEVTPPNNKPRPTMRSNPWNLLSKKVDALNLLEARFRLLDAAVRKLRARGAPPASVGFVTFVDAMSAQVAAQTVHYPLPAYAKTHLAPEPRDIIWSNVAIPQNERRVRQLLVSTFTFALFAFYVPPLAFLASLLSPETIRKYLPGLYDLLAKDERLLAFVSTSLPSVVLISFNALLPLVLEWTAHLQGLKARSLVEFSVLKRYYIFLLTSVIFIFLVTSTALGVIADLAGNPMRIIDKLAQELPRARRFGLSYVVFQAFAVIPLQLLQLPVIFGRAFGRLSARTPREHAELNAPPQLYTGSVYPSALIVFTLCIVYSIVSPLITLFGALYFALAYLIYKYKLLFVFYRSYESRGQAYPLSSTRCLWALCLFQLFQLSLFSVRKQLLLSTLMLPLIVFTVWFGLYLQRTFGELSEYVNISSIAEVNRPVSSATTAATTTATTALQQQDPSAPAPSTQKAGKGNPITALRNIVDSLDPAQTALSRKRYAAKDEALFVARKDKHTDYREPPMGGYFFGTLNTGRRRYGHPALTGILPEVWLPIRVEEEEKIGEGGDAGPDQRPSGEDVEAAGNSQLDSTNLLASSRIRKSSRVHEAVVVSLRRRKSSLLPRSPSTHAVAAATENRSSSRRKSNPYRPGPDSATGNKGAATGSKLSTSDPYCEEPSHQHEDSMKIWGDSVAGPQGATQGASIGEVLAGDESVAPVRRRLSTNVEGAEEEDRAQDDDDDDDDDDEEESDEDDSELEDEGVYIHRAIKDRLPGSFPGFTE